MKYPISRNLLCMLAFLIPLAGPAVMAEEKVHNGFTYTVENGEVTITGYSGSENPLVLPSQIGGAPVTRIADRAHWSGWWTSGWKTFVVPDSVIEIGDDAFVTTNGLTKIVIGKNVNHIGRLRGLEHFFSEIEVSGENPVFSSEDGVLFDKARTALIRVPPAFVGHYSIPATVTHIGEYAFRGCHQLSSVDILEGVISIGDSAFDGGSGLTTITIPDSVTSIGDWAFYGCSGLTVVTIPKNVVSIGNGVFAATSGGGGLGLEINVASGNPAFTSKDGILFDKAMTTLIQFTAWPEGTAYVVPEGVTNIRPYACTGRMWGVAVVLPSTMTHIDDRAFASSRIRSVVIGENVVSIGERAFSGSSNLGSVVFSESVVSIGERAFASTLLTSVVIPDAVESIGAYAFASSSNLYEVIFGSGVRHIGEGAFHRTAIGAEVRYRHGFPLLDRPGELILPDHITHIGRAAFADCEYLGRVRLPNGLEEIAESLFEVHPLWFTGELTSVEIPDSVKRIGARAFAGCKKLIEVKIGNGVEEIGAEAFLGCHKLESVVVPAGVTRIGDRAFSGGPAHVYFLGDAPSDVGEDLFTAELSARVYRYASTFGWAETFAGQPVYILSGPQLWKEARFHAAGWRSLEWFGAFVPVAYSNWIYHADHGWLYCRAGTTEQLAIHFPLSGQWATTGEAFYPWFYVHNPVNAWMVLDSGGDESVLITASPER